MGVFGDWAEKYIESGLSVIPVRGKRAFTSDWSKYCRQIASAHEIEEMTKEFADCGIGLCLGPASGVMAIDVDSDDKMVVEIVDQILPPSPCIKAGKKGFTAFYKFSGQKSQTIRSKGVQVLDVLCDGRQTVMPPSIHPETNAPYVWTGSITILDIGDDLPTLTQEQIDMLAKALDGVFMSRESKVDGRGRNDSLKAYVCALADKHSVNEIVDMALNYDATIFEKKRLFTDKEEFKSEDAFSNAFDFVTNILKSVMKLKQSRGESTHVGPAESDSLLWPSRATNFHEPVDGGGWKPMFEEMAFYMDDQHGYVSCEGASYIYNGKHYVYCSDLELKSIVASLLDERYSPMKANQFSDAVRTFRHRPEFDQTSPPGYLNLSNGVLDLSAKKIEPHSKTRFFKYVLSTSYDSAAQCPEWLKFLDFVFEGNRELVDASQEIFGYCLEGGYPWLHKGFFLYGDGRNGKSTWLDTLTALVGKENCSAVPLSALDKPFSVVMADGKLINAVSEGESRDLSSEAFKAACSGDTLIAAHKGKPEYSMPWTARMVVSLNNLPNFRDASVGNIERIYTLPFNRYIAPEERDSGIKKRIESEVSGILNWAIEGLERLKKRGRLMELEAQKEVNEAYKKNADSVYEWAVEHVEASRVENCICPGVYYNHYKTWSKDTGRYPVQKSIFSKNLTKYIKNKHSPTSPYVSMGKIKLLSHCIINLKLLEL